jgi:hypothetical protein
MQYGLGSRGRQAPVRNQLQRPLNLVAVPLQLLARFRKIIVNPVGPGFK